jgi:hypothetical protein
MSSLFLLFPSSPSDILMPKLRDPISSYTAITSALQDIEAYTFWFHHIVIWWLKARIVEQEEVAIGMQWHGKHVSSAHNNRGTFRSIVFYVVLAKAIQRGPAAVQSVLSCIVISCYLAMTSEETEDFMCGVVVICRV